MLLSLYVLVATNIPAVTVGTSREVVPDPGDALTFEISQFDQNMLLKSSGLNKYRSHDKLLLMSSIKKKRGAPHG